MQQIKEIEDFMSNSTCWAKVYPISIQVARFMTSFCRGEGDERERKFFKFSLPLISFSSTEGALSLHDLAQHGGQDAAVFVVVDVDRAIQTGDGLEGVGRAILAGDSDHDLLARAQVLLNASDVKGL